MPDTVQNAFVFLINTFFTLYLYILMIRVLLVWAGANYFDPITQFVVKLTDFIIKPLRRFMPNVNRIETITILLILTIELIKFFFISMIMSIIPHIIGLFILSIADMLRILMDTLFYAILLQVILSWLQPYSPVNRILYQLTFPIMRPIQKFIPPIAGIDISPLFAIIALQFLNYILVQPLIFTGWRITSG
jgi:YggT family protein